MAYTKQQWAEAKARCRLNDEDIAIAKRLGLNPRSLIKNIPNKTEQWKAPVKEWLHRLDEDAKDKAARRQRKKEQP